MKPPLLSRTRMSMSMMEQNTMLAGLHCKTLRKETFITRVIGQRSRVGAVANYGEEAAPTHSKIVTH
eukprot:3754111-Pyramimonas_sp.AAC.1